MTDNTAPSPTPPAPSADTRTSDATPEQHWVHIERQYGPDVTVGPYPSREIADAAYQDAVIIDGLCEEDCLDAFVTTDQPTDAHEQVLLDPEDPHFFARSGLGAPTAAPGPDSGTGDATGTGID